MGVCACVCVCRCVAVCQAVAGGSRVEGTEGEIRCCSHPALSPRAGQASCA